MNIKDLKESKFLKKEDVGGGVLATIRTCTQENVAVSGAPQELKWALHFDELDKPLILNSTNGQIIAQALGSEETEQWTGRKIVLYSDPSITFQGKLVGGIRVRAPRGAAAQANQATQRPVQPAAPPTSAQRLAQAAASPVVPPPVPGELDPDGDPSVPF